MEDCYLDATNLSPHGHMLVRYVTLCELVKTSNSSDHFDYVMRLCIVSMFDVILAEGRSGDGVRTSQAYQEQHRHK